MTPCRPLPASDIYKGYMRKEAWLGISSDTVERKN